MRAGRGPLLAPCSFLPGHERREVQDVFPALSFPIPAAGGRGSDKKKGGRKGQMLVPRSCCEGKDGAGGPPAAKSSLMVVVVPLMFNLGSVSAELAAPASSLPPASQQLSQICFAFIYIFFQNALHFFLLYLLYLNPPCCVLSPLQLIPHPMVGEKQIPWSCSSS